MTRAEYLAWHANGRLWVRLVRIANDARRHAARCPHPHPELLLVRRPQ